MKGVAAFCLMTVMLLSSVSANAAMSRYYNFDEEYELTGNGAEDMVSIALAQEGFTGSDLGYTENWCADFISDCAVIAMQQDAVPFNGAARYLKTALLEAGGKITTSAPEVGDICFINWSCGSSIKHAEIVYHVSGEEVYTIGGNSGNDNLSRAWVKKHAPLSEKYIVCIVRPNYKNSKICNDEIAEDIAIFDMNGDGSINSRDLMLVQKNILGIDITAWLDINEDSRFDSRDLVLLQRRVLGIF